MPFEPLVLGKLSSFRSLKTSRSQSATWEHWTIVAGAPGSRSNAIIVGRLMSLFFESDVCSSRSARLAAQTRVGRSLARQKSIVLPRAGTGVVFTQLGRCLGHCFS